VITRTWIWSAMAPIPRMPVFSTTVKTHGSIVTNIALGFTILSPLIGPIIVFTVARFFSQSSF
jgi:hypothetical protein